MYLFFGIFFLILLLFFFLNHWRRKKIIRKVCDMCMDEKCEILNGLIHPFGYSYILSQDLFTSCRSAWQRDMGYCALFDRAAPGLNMVFDALPVYFDYQGRTWLMEFWKGQYGINTGGEIGVYHADCILDETERKITLFQSADDEYMPKLAFSLCRKSEQIAKLCERHWWLTAFKMGCFSKPSDLFMKVSVTFPSHGMAKAFAEGLVATGYDCADVCICRQTVTFTFDDSPPVHGLFCRLQRRIAQCMNRFWCKVYCFVTRPFCLSVDRVLYLYYYLPFVLRRMLRIRKYKRRWKN